MSDATSAQPLEALARQGSKLNRRRSSMDPISGAVSDIMDIVKSSSTAGAEYQKQEMTPIEKRQSMIKEGNFTYKDFLLKIRDAAGLTRAMDQMKSSMNGLTDQARDAAEIKYGLNIAVEPMTVTPFILLFAAQWTDFIVLLLLASGIAMAFLGEVPACIMIALILGANAMVGAVMEHNGLKQLAALVNSEKTMVTCIVDGAETTKDTRELFPGDVIQLAQGSKVPADCFIVQTKSEGPTRSDANLNGESDPIVLCPHLDEAEHAESQFPANALPGGSVMMTGTVLAMVYQTGKKTMAGQTQMSMASGEEEDPETTKKVDALIKKVGYVSILAGVVVFAVGMIMQQGGDPNSDQALWLQLLMISVSLIAAAVPEGLPVVKVIVMAKAMVSMSHNHAQMRSTKATENSAGITVLCSDKTGTLTEGIMSFVRLVVGGTQRVLEINGGAPDDWQITSQGAAFQPKSYAPGAETDNMLGGFSCIMNQCAATSTYKGGTWESTGSSNFIDIAASRFNASDLGKSLSDKYSEADIAVDHPFDPAVKFAASVYKDAAADCFVVIVKGASDKPDFEAFMTEADKTARDSLSDEGLRLLALLTRKVPTGDLNGELPKDFFSKARILDGLSFCGFAAFQDPPRQDAKLAVGVCRDSAGICVKMITGDNPRTALSIAKQIGIAEENATLESGVIHMQDPLILEVFTEHADLERLQEDAQKRKKGSAPFTKQQQETLDAHSKAIAHWITTRNVIARALPMHKRTIVRILQSLGEIVAMTGDGVNDAAALKSAHLGVAMDNGADVTKEAADMVLRDCKFSTIVNIAIQGGRVISVNLKKFIYLLGSTNIAEVLIFILGTFMGLPAPATAILVLYINLITDSIVALALGLEPQEEGVMAEGPANPKEPLIGNAMWVRIILHTIWSTAMFLTFYICMLIHYTGQWQGQPAGTTMSKANIEAGITGARTAVVQLIVASEMLRGYTAKNFDTNDWRFNNPLLNFSVFSGIGITIAIAVIPGINDFFSLGGKMDATGWAWSMGLSFTVFPVDALLKALVPRTKAFHTHAVVQASEVPNQARYGLLGVASDHVGVTVGNPTANDKLLAEGKQQS